MERYRNYIRPYLAAFIAGPILMLTEVAGEIALPKMMSLIINNGVANHDVGYILRIGAAMIGFAMLMLLGGVGEPSARQRPQSASRQTCGRICFTRSSSSRLKISMISAPVPW